MAGWKSRVKGMSASIKAEYEAGKRGDDTPAAPIWATPKQQVDGLVALFRKQAEARGAAREAQPAEAGGPEAAVEFDANGDAVVPSEAEETADAATVAEMMRNVDWAGVRTATAERTADATKAMKAMADHVDWGKVQPVAAQVSSALIAAIATGQLGVGGPLAGTVARAMTNQRGLGQRVAAQLETTPEQVPLDLGATIEAVSREA